MIVPITGDTISGFLEGWLSLKNLNNIRNILSNLLDLEIRDNWRQRTK